MDNTDPSLEFSKEKHIKYLLMFLKSKSENLATVECHKLFNLYFVLTGLDILDSLDKLTFLKSILLNIYTVNNAQLFHKKMKIVLDSEEDLI